MERAATSVPMNVSEAVNRKGGHQRERFETAMGSARECIAACEVSVRAKYLSQSECEAAIRCADGIAAQLWCCLYRRG